MAQVVRPQGFIGPIVLLIVGVVLLINGVPALIQWIGWVAQVSLVSGVERAIEQAAVPLLLAAGSTFVGFLLLRGGWIGPQGEQWRDEDVEKARSGEPVARPPVDQHGRPLWTYLRPDGEPVSFEDEAP